MKNRFKSQKIPSFRESPRKTHRFRKNRKHTLKTNKRQDGKVFGFDGQSACGISANRIKRDCRCVDTGTCRFPSQAVSINEHSAFCKDCGKKESRYAPTTNPIKPQVSIKRKKAFTCGIRKE